MRAAQDVPEYAGLIDYWMTNKYTLRYTGGLVPDIWCVAGMCGTPSPRPSDLAARARAWALLVNSE